VKFFIYFIILSEYFLKVKMIFNVHIVGIRFVRTNRKYRGIYYQLDKDSKYLISRYFYNLKNQINLYHIVHASTLYLFEGS